MDSGRPVPITMRSKFDGSIGGYEVDSSMAEQMQVLLSLCVTDGALWPSLVNCRDDSETTVLYILLD